MMVGESEKQRTDRRPVAEACGVDCGGGAKLRFAASRFKLRFKKSTHESRDSTSHVVSSRAWQCSERSLYRSWNQLNSQHSTSVGYSIRLMLDSVRHAHLTQIFENHVVFTTWTIATSKLSSVPSHSI